MLLFFFCKQKTAYEMRSSDGSSDVCSSDLPDPGDRVLAASGGIGAALRVNLLLTQRRVRDDRSEGFGGFVSHGAGNVLEVGQALDGIGIGHHAPTRPGERRVGNEWGSTCRSRWPRHH